MKVFTFLSFGLLIFLASPLHAEGNCPPGYYSIGASAGQGGPQGCAPIPGYNNQQQVQSQQAPPQWVRQWGAIATDGIRGSLGTATGMGSRALAEQTAMSDCQAKGGSKCEVDVAYDNECAAMVVGSNGYNVNADITLDAATQLAMQICLKGGDKNCHVYYSACSFPVQIQ